MAIMGTELYSYIPVFNILSIFSVIGELEKTTYFVSLKDKLTGHLFLLLSGNAIFFLFFMPGGICDKSAAGGVRGICSQPARLHACNADGLHGSAPKVHGEFPHPPQLTALVVFCWPICSSLLSTWFQHCFNS